MAAPSTPPADWRKPTRGWELGECERHGPVSRPLSSGSSLVPATDAEVFPDNEERPEQGTSVVEDLLYFYDNKDDRVERKHKGMVSVQSDLALDTDCLSFKDADEVLPKKSFN